MALLPPDYLDCIVAIGAATDSGTQWLGTGFLVGKPSAELNAAQQPAIYTIYMITNKHVVEGVSEFVVRFNPTDSAGAIRDYKIARQEDGKPRVFGHPDASVDVAAVVLPLKNIVEDDVRIRYFRIPQDILSSSQAATEGVTEGDFIFTLGFPLGLMAADRKYPIARSGIIARIHDLYEKRSSDFLIDSNIFPGNSGGPVVLCPEQVSIVGTQTHPIAKLLGIVCAYLPFRDEAISRQSGNVRITFEENSGLGIVVPSDRILEAIEFAFEQQTRQEQ
jgi:S1-C subfamily serine protease